MSHECQWRDWDCGCSIFTTCQVCSHDQQCVVCYTTRVKPKTRKEGRIARRRKRLTEARLKEKLGN